MKIRKLVKKKFIILLATTFSGVFLNNFAEATVLNNSYKEVIDHVWQIVYRDFLDSSGKFQKSNWINLRKEVLSKTYSDSNEAYDAIRDMLSNLDDSYTRFLEPKEFNQMRIDTSGELTGVGIQIVKDKESDDLIIISPIEGTPAFDAGIKSRDKIISGLSEQGKINVKTKNPEFSSWKWIEPKDLPKIAVTFKVDVYKKILKELIFLKLA